ncbi:transketolase family protein [Ilumatobacter coccineus]|uniref:Transketolase n=1 Tax=Ilumatobacter coccineus (strain NBRC 103263 / KCTC 29153 / YM16-304) TaxID=1313172 RepID=A0A6C7EAS9_ILUCY|nr:transketolase C-terminal domain-containing protein [Ilumatobacter coccineus]BAN03490.1 transketolase [Ilumatobacter coccineus YM16-304]
MTTISSPAPAPTHDNRLAFSDELLRLAADDPRIVAVCNDSVGSSKLEAFRDAYPNRLVNVGIAEQNMVGIGAGLASAGLIPFVCAAGPFLTARALEQIKADVAYSQLPVILCGMSPGVAYGELGPTHHSIEDYSWMRALPGVDIVVPADRAQTRAAVRALVEHPRPTYMRVGRYKVPDVSGTAVDGSPVAIERGRFQQVRDGDDVTLVGIGTTVSLAEQAAVTLADRGVAARVLNATHLAPFDRDAVERAARDTRAIVTIEEANVAGGLGAAVAMVVGQLRREQRVPLRVLGFDRFAETGSAAFLLHRAGLTAPSIVGVVEEVLSDDDH